MGFDTVFIFIFNFYFLTGSWWVLYSNNDWWQHPLRVWECHFTTRTPPGKSPPPATVSVLVIHFIITKAFIGSFVWFRLNMSGWPVCIEKGLSSFVFLLNVCVCLCVGVLSGGFGGPEPVKLPAGWGTLRSVQGSVHTPLWAREP